MEGQMMSHGKRLAAIGFSIFIVGWFAYFALRRQNWQMVMWGVAVVVVLIVWAVLVDRADRPTGRVIILVLLLAAASQIAAANPLVVGVAAESRVELSAVPHASGAWGTDYLTATHGLRVGGNQITLDGRQFEAAQPIVICSGITHGIDAMLLRVAAHRNRPVTAWGDTSELKPGDELRVVPYDLPTVTVRLLHHVFEQWADRGDDGWPAEVSLALVAEARDLRSAPGLAGYSGAPWIRNGRAYGLHKGSAKAKPQQGREDEKIVALAEPVARIKECLNRAGYRVPE